MCYSFESSIKTSLMSFASVLYLYTSGIDKFKWLASTLIGWSIMQFAEALLWLTKPSISCTNINRILTLTLIPLVLMSQSLGSLFGSFYSYPWNKLTTNYKLIYIIYTLIVVAIILYSQFGNIQNTCTTVTPSGHLDWSTNKSDVAFGITSSQAITITTIVIALPLILLWKNKSELIVFSIIPILAAYYGTSTDSPASVWCYYTSFSSIIFALKLYLHKLGIFI